MAEGARALCGASFMNPVHESFSFRGNKHLPKPPAPPLSNTIALGIRISCRNHMNVGGGGRHKHADEMGVAKGEGVGWAESLGLVDANCYI